MIPKIVLTRPEKIWLTYLYEKFKKGKRVNYREGISELGKKIPDNFDPRGIDYKLVRHGEEITLAGILLVDPKTDLTKKVDQVLQGIKKFLLDNPHRQDIQIKELADSLGMEVEKVGPVLKLAFQFSGYTRGYSHNQETGWPEVANLSDDDIFNKYRSFKSINEEIKEQFNEKLNHSKKEQKSDQLLEENEKLTILPYGRMLIKPIFNSRISQVNERICFIIMPFKTEWSDRVFNKHFRPSIEKLGFQCLRSDMKNGQVVIEDIWTGICQASFLIADVTDQNPNVMYELGIAHTLGKPVLMLTQNLEKIPFDMRHLRHEEYEYSMNGLDSLNVKLIEKIRGFHKEHFPDSAVLGTN